MTPSPAASGNGAITSLFHARRLSGRGLGFGGARSSVKKLQGNANGLGGVNLPGAALFHKCQR
jgi:hypothetical protein